MSCICWNTIKKNVIHIHVRINLAVVCFGYFPVYVTTRLSRPHNFYVCYFDVLRFFYCYGSRLLFLFYALIYRNFHNANLMKREQKRERTEERNMSSKDFFWFLLLLLLQQLYSGEYLLELRLEPKVLLFVCYRKCFYGKY